MSYYHNLCMVSLCSNKCKQEPFSSYTITAVLSAVFGLLNLTNAITGSIILNNSEYTEEDNVCMDSFLFNFMIVVYSAVYGIALIYNAIMILKSTNTKLCFPIDTTISLMLIIFGSLDYNTTNNCEKNASSIYYLLNFWYTIIRLILSVIFFIIGFIMSKYESTPIMNDGSIEINYIIDV